MKNEIESCWLWPDHVIGKRESRQLRDEHNALVNDHASLLAERDVLKDLLLHTQRAAIEVAEERDRLRHCLSFLLRADEMPPSIEAAMQQARDALAEGGK